MRFGLAVFMVLVGVVSAAAERALPADLEGLQLDPFAGESASVIVFAFMADECPISNRYAPKMNRYAARYGAEGARFWAVYADDLLSTEAILKHRADFGYTMPALHDAEKWLVKKTDASVTPEVAVYAKTSDGGHELVYLGRIDDQYLNYGKWRHEATQRDLEEVVEAALAGETLAFRKTRAVGCYIAE